jgi:hypothetical protein
MKMVSRVWAAGRCNSRLFPKTTTTTTNPRRSHCLTTEILVKRSLSSLSSSATAGAFDNTATYEEASHRYHQVTPLTNCELDTRSEAYREAIQRTQSQVKDLEKLLHQVAQGGGSNAVQRHLDRNKLLPRDRIRQLVDPGTPVLELSALAGYEQKVASGGIVSAIGSVSGRQCMMIANDATVKGGTVR